MARLLSEMGLLGQRTAELHLALSSETDDAAFAAEPFTAEFQSALLRSVEQLTHRTMGLLRARMSEIPAEYKWQAAGLAERENEVGERFRSALAGPIDALRIRIHGDYHLGQVLYTGSDFVIIDFEGEPARPLAERRLKQSPLQDVAGMLRSFHYAAFAPILTPAQGQIFPQTRVTSLSMWAEEWSRRASGRFLDRYYETSRGAAYLPSEARERTRLLEMYLLAKAIYELGYELNNRPSWVAIPLEGIARLLSARD
jgi:maltose alpha-D-glucosyltransferase/alpha-amylase